MTKIAEIVTIHGGYAKYVNLVQEFGDLTQNRERMKRYMPIKSHREAFSRMSRALYPMDNRVYLLTGSYGTGKSHLCLMLANYLAHKTNDPELKVFFDNWAQQDAEEAEKLRNLRGEGRYLVALCDYGMGDDFDSMVLRAVNAAVERESLGEVWLDTHFQEAARQIERWEERQQAGKPSGTFSDFQAELAVRHPGWTLAALKEDLQGFSQEALNIFRELYRLVVGSPFTYSKDNLVDILKDFLANPGFKERYKGLAVIADEFGYVLDRGQIRVDVFQRFAEMCHQGVAGSQLMFFGTGHKAFSAYAAGRLSATDFRVAADRVEEIPLRSEELELIMGSIVTLKKNSGVWQSEVLAEGGMFNRFALASSRLGIFKHLKGPELRQRVIENIYPMHPMATHCLIELSTEVGSDARSVFAFFSGALETEPVAGSYSWYVNDHEVKVNGRLNLYTADKLYTYFQNELRPETTEAREAVRQHIRNYEASAREVRKQAQAGLIDEVDTLVERALKLMLIYEISKVAPTFDNLAFGLYCETPAEKSQLQNRLNALVKQQALYLSSTGIYEFRSSQSIGFEELIEEYLSDPENAPQDLAKEVTTLIPLGRGGQWLDAKNHNQSYGEDKRLLRVFALPGDLEGKYPDRQSGDQVNYFTHLERRRQTETSWKDRYEGTAVYVLCESDEEIARARQAAEANQHEQVIVGIPRQPIPIYATVMNLRAALHIEQTQDTETMSLQDRTRLQSDIIGDDRQETGFMGELARARKRYLMAADLNWYGRAGDVLVAQPQSEYEPADELMGRLYQKNNRVLHPYLNQIHVSKFGPGKDVPLTDAVNALLKSHRSVEIDHSAAANRGEIRYLKNVLADTGALRQKGAFQGNIAHFEVELDADKFRAKLPALAGMLDRLRTLAQGETMMVRQFLEAFADTPYGQGPIALSLFLAHTIRAFGDELRLQLQPGAVGYSSMSNPDLVLRLVEGSEPNAIFERQAISAAERDLINGIFQLFAAEPGAAGQSHTVREAYDVLQAWWYSLPNLAKAAEVYEPGTTTRELVSLLRNIDAANPYRLVLDQLQTPYGFDEDRVISAAEQVQIIEKLQADKAAIEQRPRQIKDRLIKDIMRLEDFEVAGETYGHFQEAIQNWYTSLDDGQRDEYSSWHTHTSSAIARRLPKVTNIEETFLERLPADAGFGLGAVETWHRDRSDEYITKLQDALEHIAKHRIKVPFPEWQVPDAEVTRVSRIQAQVKFRSKATLEIQAPQPGVTVYVTTTGEDPRKATQRLAVDKSDTVIVEQGGVVNMASGSPDGGYGQVVSLSFVDQDQKHRITSISGPIIRDADWDPEFKFVFPTDRSSLLVLLSSIFEEVLEKNVIDEQQIDAILSELESKLKRTP